MCKSRQPRRLTLSIPSMARKSMHYHHCLAFSTAQLLFLLLWCPVLHQLSELYKNNTPKNIKKKKLLQLIFLIFVTFALLITSTVLCFYASLRHDQSEVMVDWKRIIRSSFIIISSRNFWLGKRRPSCYL